MNLSFIDSYISKDYCLHKLNRLDDSKLVYAQALEYYSDNAVIYYNLGCVLTKQMKQMKYEKAFLHFYKAVKLDASFDSALDNKEMALKILNNEKALKM